MLHIFLGKRVSRSAAELAYFLTMSVFPMLICLHAMLGNLLPESQGLLQLLDGLIPEDTMSVLSDYLVYVSTHNSTALLIAGLAVMATSSAGAFRSLHNIMADIQGIPRFRGLRFVVSSFFFSLIFLAVIYFAIIVLLTGSWFIRFLDNNLSLHISGAWQWLRFLMLFAALFFIIYGIYRFTAPKGTTRIMTGALAASIALVTVSVVPSGCVRSTTRRKGREASAVVMTAATRQSARRMRFIGCSFYAVARCVWLAA